MSFPVDYWELAHILTHVTLCALWAEHAVFPFARNGRDFILSGILVWTEQLLVKSELKNDVQFLGNLYLCSNINNTPVLSNRFYLVSEGLSYSFLMTTDASFKELIYLDT